MKLIIDLFLVTALASIGVTPTYGDVQFKNEAVTGGDDAWACLHYQREFGKPKMYKCNHEWTVFLGDDFLNGGRLCSVGVWSKDHGKTQKKCIVYGVSNGNFGYAATTGELWFQDRAKIMAKNSWNTKFEWTPEGYLMLKGVTGFKCLALQAGQVKVSTCNPSSGWPITKAHIWTDIDGSTPPAKATSAPSAAPTEATAMPIDTEALKASEDADKCLTETYDILKILDADYKDTEFITKADVGGELSEHVDYNANGGGNDVYKKHCEVFNVKEHGYTGVYKALDYSATCTQYSTETKLKVYVYGHPRCYSSSCDNVGPEETKQLFDLYTMHLTEERNEGWTCDGKLDAAGDKAVLSAKSSCEWETSLLSSLDKITHDSNGIEPKFEEKKKWFVLPLKEKDVTFGTNGAFSNTCEEQNGVPDEIKGKKVMCQMGDDTAKAMPFEIKSFPVCLGKTCSSAESDKEAAVASLFQEEMLKAKSKSMIESGMVCKIVSAGTGLFGGSALVATLLSSVLSAGLMLLV